MHSEHASRRRASTCLCLLVLLASATILPGQSPLPEPVGSKTWIGRYQEVEEYLRTAECIRIEELIPGSAMRRCVLPPGGPVSRMAWRPPLPGTYRGFRESYKADIAAYELDRLLDLGMVPPAVEREVMGQGGAAIFWVEDVSDVASSSRAGTSPAESDRAHWQAQLERMRMFDDLIGNKDRNLANMLHDAGWNLILIDHSRAFWPDTELSYTLTGVDRDFWARIEALTRQQLDAALSAWLDDRQIDAILSRREKMRVEVRRLLNR